MERKQTYTVILRLVAIVSLLALFLTVPSLYSAPTVAADEITDMRDQLAQLQKEQKELEAAIKNLGTDIKSQQTKVAKLQQQVKNLEAQIEAYEAEIASVDAKIAEQETRIEELNGEIAVKQAELDAILAKLKKRLQAFSKTGNYSSLQLLLNTENYEDYLLKAEVIKRITQHDQALLDAAEAEKQAIAAIRQTVEAEKTANETAKADLEALKIGLDTQFAELDALYTEAYKAKAELEKKLGTYQKEQEKIKKAEAELEREIEQLQNSQTSSTYGGKMYWPVPAVKQISCSYGQKPTYFHGGTDIWGPGILKKPILAAADGVVVKSVSMHYSYGNYVMVDHGYDSQGRRIMTLYAHMYATPPVKVGDTVIGGKTQLGLVGSTGNSTGPHLHFEVRVDGARVDPIGNGYIVKPR